MEAFDPETDQPYYYNAGDVERALAIYHGVLDTSVSNPSWVQQSCMAKDTEPRKARKPRRSQYPTGAAGQKAFHEARATWYYRKVGRALAGTAGEQVKHAHDASRNERVRNGTKRVRMADA